MRNKIVEIIYDSIDDIKDSVPAAKDINKSEDTALFGNEGFLDSLGLVTLIVAVEQNLQEELSLSVTLAD